MSRTPAPIDTAAARELVLYAINTEHLYTSRALPIARNLARKHRAGTYDAALAVTAWGYLATAAAHSYEREHGCFRATFSPATRRAAAVELSSYYADLVAELVSMPPAIRRRYHPLSLTEATTPATKTTTD